MINILVHGLGQTDKSWDKVKEILNQGNINAETPDLFEIAKNYQLTYENVFTVFVDYCNSFSDKLNLVGLSLGGILAIDYAILHPEKVNSITLCGVPYEMPKKLLKIQNFIFKFMPKRTFDNIGISKENFIQLTNSMAELNIKEKISKLKCHTLVICGEKDSANIESANKLNENIKNSELKIIKNAEHEVNIDAPEKFAEIIKGFLVSK